MVVRAWDPREETIRTVEDHPSSSACSSSSSSPSSSKEYNAARKRELDPFLAPYPYDNHKKWISLTNHVSMELARALCPSSGLISSFTELIAEDTFQQKNVHSKNRMETEGEGEKMK